MFPYEFIKCDLFLFDVSTSYNNNTESFYLIKK